jgi:inward rectifier potassium channel
MKKNRQPPHPDPNMPVVINRDGSLNIHRPPEKGRLFSDFYHYFLSISWTKFFAIFILIFLSYNIFFGLVYFGMGRDALEGIRNGSEFDRLVDSFFYSVKTLDRVSPVGLIPNIVGMTENYLGMLTLVIITGLLYARFARPSARVLFSDFAIINRYNGRPCFTFRVANARLNQIIEARMTLTLTKNATSAEGETSRKLYPMKLEGDYSPLFALSWTIRHFIDEDSPLFGLNAQALKDQQVVVFASLSGVDDTFGQTITARSVYRYDEIAFHKRFKDILVWDGNAMHIDLKGIHAMVDEHRSAPAGK